MNNNKEKDHKQKWIKHDHQKNQDHINLPNWLSTRSDFNKIAGNISINILCLNILKKNINDRIKIEISKISQYLCQINPFFKKLPKEILNQLHSIIKIEEYQANELLENNPTTTYIILSGHIQSSNNTILTDNDCYNIQALLGFNHHIANTILNTLSMSKAKRLWYKIRHHKTLFKHNLYNLIDNYRQLGLLLQEEGKVNKKKKKKKIFLK